MSEEASVCARRVRHLTAIQVCNLTPFPVRDAFASALAHPADKDDFGNVLARLRSRKLSDSASSRSLRSHRARTSSIASSLPPTLDDYSQPALERLIRSRLVHSFIALSVPHLPPPPSSPAPLRSAPSTKSSFAPPSIAHTLSRSASHSPSASSITSPSKSRFPPDSAPPTRSTFTHLNHASEASDSPPPHVNGSSSTHRKASSMAATHAFQSIASSEPSVMPDSPVYFSPIHRPSTNPLFPIDARSPHDFPYPCDVGGSVLKVEVWGTTSKSTSSIAQGWQSHQSRRIPLDREWKLLDEWDVHLDNLVPLPDDLDNNPAQLPSNTLVITLHPPGRRFYLPTTVKVPRPPSPSAGYSSDPESEVRKGKQRSDNSHDVGSQSIDVIPRTRRQKAVAKEIAKTVTWTELFKLVTLQSLIADNQSTLDRIMQKIDGLLKEDDTFLLRRKLLVHEARLSELLTSRDIVSVRIAERKQEIMKRSQRLRERVDALGIVAGAITFNVKANVAIESERTRLSLLRKKATSAQTSLLATLSTIFPIELLSPPDLLYTILDVPLPIPLTSNEPAPPLTLPDHKDVTEEAVATALGYVAQVLQLLAAYVGTHLIYPITYVGSRSLIRDGISAMVGPRMFPLFPKGVDTYRFEYGVFLLNKNIEMLMVTHDLRALDMRHTLPNLKNLLLTLSHGASVQFPPRHLPSPASSTSGLQTPSREPSPVPEEPTTPKAAHLAPSAPSGESTTPTPSGASTPTASTDDRKGKSSFLGFVPFSDFLLGRYPSAGLPDGKTSRTSSSGEMTESSLDEAEPDEEDRITIRGDATVST